MKLEEISLFTWILIAVLAGLILKNIIGAANKKYPETRSTLLDEDPATDKQWNYIFHLCDELDMDYPDENLTKEQASNMITKLKARLYDDDDNQY